MATLGNITIGQITVAFMALVLMGALVGCDVGDHRLPPNYRLEKNTGYDDDDDDYYRGSGPPPPRSSSERFPTPEGPDRDYDDSRSSRDRDYDRPRSRSDRDYDRSDRRPSGASSSRSREIEVDIVYGRTSKASLQGRKDLKLASERLGRDEELLTVTPKGQRTYILIVTDRNRRQESAEARSAIFVVRDGVVVGLESGPSGLPAGSR
ncbi:MAG: hypothetical protein LBS60_13625 [Deltaproteobacteria bacterium]|jgi:hypothetical protein|nr:hypothetical protein [Deltaproteobacteria bacterium]